MQFCSVSFKYYLIGFVFATLLFSINKSDLRAPGYFTLRKHAHEIYRNWFGCKKSKISLDYFIYFLICAQNIDWGYTLEPHRRRIGIPI